jgi:hypothetical protein
MSSAVENWQEEFDKEGTIGYKEHGCFDFRSGGMGERKKIFPTHINQGLWLQEYGGVTITNDPGLCRQFVCAATKHAPIGEYQQQFFPDKDFHCPGHLNAPETQDHILNECSWYVRCTGHYNSNIPTIMGLTLFLCNNPQAFAFDQLEGLRHLQKDWLAYQNMVYEQREIQNKVREKKGLPPVTRPIFVHEQVGYYQTPDLYPANQEYHVP